MNCRTTNASLVVDESVTNAAKTRVLAGVGGSARVTVTFGEQQEAGRYVGVVFDPDADLTDVQVLDAIALRTRDANGNVVETASDADLLGLDALGLLDSGQMVAAFETSAPFAKVEIGFGGLVGVSVEYDVFYAFSAASAAQGSLPVTEVFPTPDDVDDTRGEYIEVYNRTGTSLDLNGFTFRNDTGGRFTIGGEGTAMNGTTVASGQPYVLCRQEGATHGGVPCDYEYPGSFDLSDDADRVDVTNRFGENVFEMLYSDGNAFREEGGIAYELVDLGAADDAMGSGPGEGNEYGPADIAINDVDEDNDGFRDLGTPGMFGNDAQPTIPVEFAGAPRATSTGTDVHLQWTTLTESNNLGFYVQSRRVESAGTTDWKRVNPEAMVEGAGNASTERSYSYRCTGLRAGRYQFRIQQVDRDGERDVSAATRAVEVRAAEAFSLRLSGENPFQHASRLVFSAPEGVEVHAALYNVLGQNVRTLEAEHGLIQVNARGLASGTYFVRLTAGDRAAVQTITLVR